MEASIDRGKTLKKQLSLGLIYKLLGMGLSYLSIPLFLKYLGEKDYGLWMTIFSIISWIYMFDMGIGNGLKNKLTESMTKNDYKSAKEYISTGYAVIGTISLVIMTVGTILIRVMNVSNILNVYSYDEYYLKKLLFIVFSLTVFNFIISLYRVLYMSEHNSTITNFANIIFQILFIGFLYFLNRTGQISLINIGILYPGINLILGVIFTINFFKNKKYLIPSFKYFKKDKVKKVGGLGIEFFLIQLSMLIILSTDNIIIARLLGVEAVTPYSIVSKLFQIFLVFSSIILTPLWTLFLDAFMKNDKKWILKILKKLNILFIVLVLGVFIAVVLTPFIAKVWLGKDLSYPKYLISFFGLFVLVRVYGDIYMYFLNGIGKVKLQMYLYILGAILNIPLSIFFVKQFNLGSSGVILATNICMLPLTIIMPIKSLKMIKSVGDKKV